MTTATARISRPGHTAAKPSRDAKSRERALAWARRAPLLPALDTGSDPVCLQTVRDGVELFSSPGLRS